MNIDYKHSFREACDRLIEGAKREDEQAEIIARRDATIKVLIDGCKTKDATIARLTAALTDIMGMLTVARANGNRVTCLWMDIKRLASVEEKMTLAYKALESDTGGKMKQTAEVKDRLTIDSLTAALEWTLNRIEGINAESQPVHYTPESLTGKRITAYRAMLKREWTANEVLEREG